MKCLLAVCVLVVATVGLGSAAPKPPLLHKGVGDIWSNCTKRDDMGVIDKVSISPDPPAIGKDITVTADFTLKEEVTGGSVSIVLKYGVIPIVDQTEDLCTILSYTQSLKCPLAKGKHTFTISDTIPGIPSGTYSGNATATDQNGKEIGCIGLKFTL